MKCIVIFSFSLGIFWSVDPQNLSGTEIGNKSISFNDPDNMWSSGHFMLDLKEIRPGNPSCNSLIEINNFKPDYHQ